MISDAQMKMHDYDWFCIINGKPVCVSSAGSTIPAVINKGNYVIDSMNKAHRLPSRYDFSLNTQFLLHNVVNVGYEYLQEPQSAYSEMLRPDGIQFSEGTPVAVQYYSEYFAKIAKRGFWVFDRVVQYNEGNRFHLVAWPKGNVDEHLLQEKIFSEYCVMLNIADLSFEEPEKLVNINLLDFFVEDNIQIIDNRQEMIEQDKNNL